MIREISPKRCARKPVDTKIYPFYFGPSDILVHIRIILSKREVINIFAGAKV